VNPTQEETSLFERIGGSEALMRMVSAFYTRVLDDRNLRPYFQGVELDKLYNMQFEFFSVALGGPSSYTGRTLQQAHRGRKISRDHFHIFVQHLLETLKEYPLTSKERHAIIARINTFADDVIGDGTKVN
jgi:hemoglobin